MTVPVTAPAPESGSETRWSLRTVLRLLASGWAASILVVFVANLAIEVVPHARGIAFPLALRYAVITPLCILVSLASVFVYHVLVRGYARPRIILMGALLLAATIVLLKIAWVGPSGLAHAAFPVLLSSALTLTQIIPPLSEKPQRSRLVLASLTLLAAAELLGLAKTYAHEPAWQTEVQAVSFDIPRSVFDVDRHFLDLPGGARIHYVDEGKGGTLLFLHGNPSWSFQWRELIHGLRDSYRCIALDYPGFGLSTAPAGFGYTPREQSLVVESFVEHLGLRDVTLVMQDWGGPIGLGFAACRPELVRDLVLGSTWAWRTDPRSPRGRFSTIVGGSIGEFAQVKFNALASFSVNHGVIRKLPPDVASLYLKPFQPPARRGIAAFYPGQIVAASSYFAELEAALPRLANKRTLIFWALQDPGFPLAELARFKAIFPNHQSIKFPKASHFFFEDAAQEMIPAMRAFLSSQQVD